MGFTSEMSTLLSRTSSCKVKKWPGIQGRPSTHHRLTKEYIPPPIPTDLLSELQTFRVYGELKHAATTLKNTLPTYPVIQEEQRAIDFDVMRRTLPHVTDYNTYQEVRRKGRKEISEAEGQ